ncbi:unnamed protein product [Lupinus luteus]|uniref:Bromo domain-containing protein n=1 Tax=Lupinus luteus TaxID=3873 RepID=A0AAV1W527_LUPLU
MALRARDSQIKLTIKFHSSSGTPNSVELYVPRPKKREQSDPSSSFDDLRCSKRCKVVASEDLAKPTNKIDNEYSSITKIGGTKEKWRGGNANVCEEKEKKKEPLLKRRVVEKDSRIIKKGSERKDCVTVNNSCTMNMMKKMATAVNTDQYPKQSVAVIKNGTTTTQYCGIVKKNEKVQKNARVVLVMDHCKKMQCWVMLKRLMTGKDSWVFKEPLMGLEILDKDYSIDNSSKSKPFIKSQIVHNQSQIKKPTCLKDIESKLNKLLYTNPDEFANDIRDILSYGLLHPPRNDIYKIARRVSNDFEVSWKSLKEKWLSGEGKGKKN